MHQPPSARPTCISTAERRWAAYILRTRSSAARATREVAGWWAMQATALPTATSPCNLCCLKSHMHKRPSSPVVTSTLLHASAAMPVTLLSCAAARRLASPTLQQQSLSLLRLGLQAASACRSAVDSMRAVSYRLTASMTRWKLQIKPGTGSHLSDHSLYGKMETATYTWNCKLQTANYICQCKIETASYI